MGYSLLCVRIGLHPVHLGSWLNKFRLINPLIYNLFKIWKPRERFLVVRPFKSCWGGLGCFFFRFLLEPTDQHHTAAASYGPSALPHLRGGSRGMAALNFNATFLGLASNKLWIFFFSSPMFRPGYRSLPACSAAPPVRDSGARSVSQVSLWDAWYFAISAHHRADKEPQCGSASTCKRTTWRS